VHLLGDALAADLREPVGLFDDRLASGWLDIQPELDSQADRAQQPQRVLGEALGRAANRPDQTRLQVGLAAERIDQLPAADVLGDGVDGEVAPTQVAVERVAELDVRLPRPWLIPLGAVGGHLDEAVAEPSADRPELLADGEDAVCPGPP